MNGEEATIMGTSRHASSGRPQARKQLRMDGQEQGWRGRDEDTWDDAAREQTSVRRRPHRLMFPPQRARPRDAYDEPYESFEPDEPYDEYDIPFDGEYNARDEDGGRFGVVEVEDEYDTGPRRVRREMTGPQTAVYSNPRLSRSPRRASASEPLGTVGRRRENSSARPLASELSPEQSRVLAQIERASEARIPVPVAVPAVASAHPAPRTRLHRPHLDTRALARSAKSPWSLTRTLLALIAVTAAIWTSLAAAGEPSQPLMSWQPGSGTHDARAITRLVQPETQGTRPDLYDSTDQFNAWWDAACSAAVMSEVLTAWGKQGATIGRMIDVMQPDISLYGGLLTPHGFQRGAQAFGYRADISWNLTYKQLLYITNNLGLPVIVNVRISYGYYHFFAGGHFLVMTGGDDQGLTIVDSSEYYIHYLPLDTFASMFTGMTAIVVPQDYTYHVP
jgi:hypothetical protein